MTEYIENIPEKTLSELIRNRYPDFKICFGSASMDMDTSHGVEINTADATEFGYGIAVTIHPYVKWSDGMYKPCHGWGEEYYIILEKR